MYRTSSLAKLSRQLNLPLTPKAGRIMLKKPYPPGQHGPVRKRNTKLSDYKRQLVEKQRLRAQYNLSERQMSNYVKEAIAQRGNPADNLVGLLERRLDAVVHRAGFARSMPAARQFVVHRHILVNGKWVNTPAHRLRVGDTVTVKPPSRTLPCFVAAAEEMVARVPDYLNRDRDTLSARLLFQPQREQVPVSCEMPLIIEYYSR